MKYRQLYGRYLELHRSDFYNLSNLDREYQRVVRFWRQKYVGKYLPADRSAKVLDVGCGLGQNLYALRELGYRHLEGVDLSAEQVGICVKKVPGATVVRADANEYLRDRKEAYDLVILFDILEHLTKDEALGTAESVLSGLKPGGAALVRVPNASCPLSMHFRYDDLTHEMCYTKQSLTALMRMAGFSRVQVVGLNPYVFHGRTVMERLAKRTLYAPMSAGMTAVFRLMYFLQGGKVGPVQPFIMGAAVK